MGSEKVVKLTWTPPANFDVCLLFLKKIFNQIFLFSQVKHVEQQLM
jgi:hypothetical protein